MPRRARSIEASSAASASASRRSMLLALAGLLLAGMLLVVFHSTVTAAVRKADATQVQYRLAAHPEPVCRGAGNGAAPDLCMLHVAVPPKRLQAARAQLRSPHGALQARAD